MAPVLRDQLRRREMSVDKELKTFIEFKAANYSLFLELA
jgi:hypothetical protein